MSTSEEQGERRLLDMGDHDGACEILRWCNGTALGEGYEPYVMHVPTPHGSQYAKSGDWIKAMPDGSFWVTEDPDRDRCPNCRGLRHEQGDPQEACLSCNGLGYTPGYTEDEVRAEAARFIGSDCDGLEITTDMADRKPWRSLPTEDFNEAFGKVMTLITSAIDTDRYAVDCGAEGLAAAGQRVVDGDEGGPVRAAFHVAVDPHLELDPRAYDAIADILRNSLSFKGES